MGPHNNGWLSPVKFCRRTWRKPWEEASWRTSWSPWGSPQTMSGPGCRDFRLWSQERTDHTWNWRLVSEMPFGIRIYGTFILAFFLAYRHTLTIFDILSDILSRILSGTYCGILPGVLPGICSNISGPAAPAELRRSRLRSGSAHWSSCSSQLRTRRRREEEKRRWEILQ